MTQTELPSEPGIELPNEPGRWTRAVGHYDILVKEWGGVGLMIMGWHCLQGVPISERSVDHLPAGGWLRATAPAADPLRQVKIDGAIEKLRDCVGTTLDFENASVDCVRDMWTLAEAFIRQRCPATEPVTNCAPESKDAPGISAASPAEPSIIDEALADKPT